MLKMIGRRGRPLLERREKGRTPFFFSANVLQHGDTRRRWWPPAITNEADSWYSIEVIKRNVQ
jgi:hypothetical protein